MSTYTIPVGREVKVQVSISRGNSVGFPTESYLLDVSDGSTVRQTENTTYSGYCHAEICEQEIAKLYPNMGWEFINYYVETAEGVPSCDCEPDE